MEEQKNKGLFRPALFDHRHHAARAENLRGSCEEEVTDACLNFFWLLLLQIVNKPMKDSRFWTEVFGATIDDMPASEAAR